MIKRSHSHTSSVCVVKNFSTFLSSKNKKKILVALIFSSILLVYLIKSFITAKDQNNKNLSLELDLVLNAEYKNLENVISERSIIDSKNEVKNSKILCYVLLSPHKIDVGKVIEQTWGSHCDKLIFFGKFISPALPITFLNTQEGYPYLWNKTKEAIKYLHAHYFHDYDWFVKADHDTFFIIENLREFTEKLNPQNPLWFGFKIRDKNMEKGYMSGGAGYVFSKSAISTLGDFLQKYSPLEICDVTGMKGYEDLELGKCTKGAGINEISTVDEMGRERFLPLPLSMMLNGGISKYHWIWKQAWNPVKTGNECCSSKLISMHQISASDMKTLYFILYKLKTKTLE